MSTTRYDVPLTVPQIAGLIGAIVAQEGEWEGLSARERGPGWQARSRALENARLALVGRAGPALRAYLDAQA